MVWRMENVMDVGWYDIIDKCYNGGIVEGSSGMEDGECDGCRLV